MPNVENIFAKRVAQGQQGRLCFAFLSEEDEKET
jgi:hypothetical protein